MKKRLTAGFCALVMLLAAGCGRGDSDAYRQINSQISQSQDAGAPAPGAPRNQRPRELTGHLTIKTFWDEQMETIIQDFTALHPGVTIDLVKAGGENDVRSLDDYGTQTVVELMSGGGPDLVDMAGFSVWKCARSGLLCDLYTFMGRDPEFRREDYYTNVWEGKEYQGGLYSMPCSFLYKTYWVSRPLLEEAGIHPPDTLTYQQMLQLQEEVAAATGESPRLIPGMNPYTFFYTEALSYYDLESRTARFSDPAFLDYLRLTKEKIPVLPNNDMDRVVYNDSFMEKDYLFSDMSISSGSDLMPFLLDHKNITSPVLLVNTAGDASFRSMRDYAIPSSSKNQELAWEFLKFYIGPREYPEEMDSAEAQKYYFTYCAFIPINRANFFQSFRFWHRYTRPFQERDMAEYPDLRWKEGDREALLQRTLERIDGWNCQVSREEAEGEIFGECSEDLAAYYYHDLLTAEETAERIQNRMTIFLQE